MTEEEKKEKDRQYAKKHYEINKAKKKEYQKENKQLIAIQKKEYWKQNKEKLSKQQKEYRKKRVYKIIEKETIRQKNKLKRQENIIEIRAKERKFVQNKRISNIIFRIKTDLRAIIGKAFRRNGYKKTSKTQEILGCSFEEFKIHIESKFEPWMNWNNRGLFNGQLNYGWDIDHIIPLDKAITKEDLIKLNHYTNLQPLCSYTNRYIKSNK